MKKEYECKHEYVEVKDQGGFLARIFLDTKLKCKKCGKVIRWEP